MVRALLAGRKTQTRRALRPIPWNANGDAVDINIASAARYAQGADGRWYYSFDHPKGGPLTAHLARFVPGDRLWVKETWRAGECWDDRKPNLISPRVPLDYLATPRENGPCGKTRVSIHMPRWASRLTLIVTEVRVERLQSISEADAIAEGVVWESADPPFYYVPGIYPHSITGVGIEEPGGRHAERSYLKLWDHINGDGAAAANPWVVAVSFDVVRTNIDQVAI